MNTMKRTISSNKRLYALITELGIDAETKETMIYNYTNGRTVHTSELTESEARQLIEKLEASIAKKKPQNRVQDELCQKLRRNVFKLMYDIGLISGNMDGNEKLAYINTWIKNKLKLDKDLNTLSLDELTTFIRQLQAIRRNYIQKTARQVQYN